MPRIFWQRVSNLVNKFALLLNKCWFTQDSWDKPKNDECWGRGFGTFSQSARNDVGSVGRSMIEMLGVLAIIGVLSVGGIAGYSKAMKEWKSTQQKEQLSSLFHTIIGLRYHLQQQSDTYAAAGDNITRLIEALGETPAGLTYKDNGFFDRDGNNYYLSFGRTCWQKSETDTTKVCDFQYVLTTSLVKTETALAPSAFDLCVNLINISKENANDVSDILTFQGNKDQWRGYDQNTIFDTKTLQTATPQQIRDKCRTCQKQNFCRVAVYFVTN